MEQLGHEWVVQPVFEQFEDQREILLQSTDQLQGGPLAFLDELPPQPGQLGQFARRLGVGLERPQGLAMQLEELGQQVSIGGIALAAGGVERLAIACRLLRIDGVDREAREFEQGVDECPAGLLEDDAQLAFGVLALERCGPGGDGLGLLLEGRVLRLGLRLGRIDETDRMDLNGPIDPDEDRRE